MQRKHTILIGQPRGAGVTQQRHDLGHLVLTAIIAALALTPKQGPFAANRPALGKAPASLTRTPLDLTPEECKVQTGPPSLILRHPAPGIGLAQQPQYLQTGTVGTRMMERYPPIAVLPTCHVLLARNDAPHHVDGRIGQLAQQMEGRGAELSPMGGGCAPLLVRRVGYQPLPQRLPRPLQLRFSPRPLLGRHVRQGLIVRAGQRRLADAVQGGDVVGPHVVGSDGTGPKGRDAAVGLVVVVRASTATTAAPIAAATSGRRARGRHLLQQRERWDTPLVRVTATIN